MSSRLDRLVSLLETGSSSAIRLTAAKQLAQLATKSASITLSFQVAGEDVKPQTSSHQADYDALMAVVGRILPVLKSKNFETRTAASAVLSNICTSTPSWLPGDPTNYEGQRSSHDPAPFPTVDLIQLMYHTPTLVASSGQEFTRALSSFGSVNDVKKAKKEAMKRLGLDFLQGVDDDQTMDWEKELEAEVSTPGSAVDLKIKTTDIKSEPMDVVTPSDGSPPPSKLSEPPETPNTAALSARELNRLKRKRKGTTAAIIAPPPKAVKAATSEPQPKAGTSASAVTGRKAGTPTAGTPPPNKVVVDPTKGGQVDAATKGNSLSKVIEVTDGEWPWEGAMQLLEIDLFDPSWSTRHGAACAIRDILKPHGAGAGMSAKLSVQDNLRAHERWCNDLCGKILCVLVLERFCDFSNDQSISPVRETVAQTLASLILHMPRRSLEKCHQVLLQMVQQEFATTSGKQPYIWQVRHGGMLGVKYEVAVRRDLLTQEAAVTNGRIEPADVDTKVEFNGVKIEPNASIKQEHDVEEASVSSSQDVLRSVVSSSILGLSDSDDDVRSVAASTLIPVADDLVRTLPDELPMVLTVLWSGLATMKDDLSSSVGAVMELLGRLAAFPEVISVLANPDVSKPLTSLAPILFSFFRHTIPNVRLQVVTTLESFLHVSDLPKDWISSAFLCLVLQNLMVEERENIRTATLSLWHTSLDCISRTENMLQSTVPSPLISDWFALVLQPWGQPLDASLFYSMASHEKPDQNGDSKMVERHNVDKAMIAQDLALIDGEVVWQARIAASRAIGYLIAAWPDRTEADTVFRDIILHYLNSNSALQRVLACVSIEECADQVVQASSVSNGADSNGHAVPAKGISANFSEAISQVLLATLNQDVPHQWHEVCPNLRRVCMECNTLLKSFINDGYFTESQVTPIPTEIDITGRKSDCFTLDTAEKVTGPMFQDLQARMGKVKKKEFAPFEARKATIITSIQLCRSAKERYDVRSMAACASALVALQAVPTKVGTVIKNLMNGVKFEESLVFQTRFASALSAMVNLGLSKLNAATPITKVVKNLCAFLCIDTSQTPTFASMATKSLGIISFKLKSDQQNEANGLIPVEEAKVQTSRRGAELALLALSRRFGSKLFETVPMIWESTTEGLTLTCGSCEPSKADNSMLKSTGQDVIDSLVTLQTVVPALHQDLWKRFASLLPAIVTSLQSRFSVIRQVAAKCFAAFCNVITTEGMLCMVQKVLPLVGDALSVTNRQGGMEAVYNVIKALDAKALPYVVFMLIPVLGRMSDNDDDVRSTATNTFASLVRMVPLEAGLPIPEGFPNELLERRDKEREFLTQLLDGSKVEQYSIPVSIAAELRKYQQDGVSWLAFLAKYQLHGILCDDMGLGKTLQSICIMASKHYERAKKYQETKSIEFAHLPSLIVCPPTLTGHWQYEILKYVTTLKPMLYTGPSRDRVKLFADIKHYDVIITSYEVIRNDIQNLAKVDWLYCILDEGHIIKNGKTKLTRAVKALKAQHRLILSGTPIQNNVLELWSLFDFLMPGFLGTEQSFNERYSKPILANRDNKSNAKTSEAAALALESLHKQVLPFLLRRLKEDVLNDLPPKIIQDYYCELSELQSQLYDEFQKSQAFQETQVAVNGTSEKGQQHVFQSLQYLKKLCNHPALVLKEESTTAKEVLRKYRQNASDASPLRDIQHAPKLLALRQLLNDCGIGVASGLGGEDKKASTDLDMEGGPTFSQHRCLIFCQMKQMLDIIETDLFKIHMPSVTYMRLDGGTETSKRHAIVQTFNGDPSIDCLLLTTHVGGLGLTLTGADTVIFVEHDWNPMKDLQAMDRAHRIGQKKVVNVYRLITKNTLEEKIMGLQRFKLNIASSVITQQNSGLASMGTDLVLDLFKRTAPDEAALAAAKENQKEGSGHKNVLAGLEDLPPMEEYSNLDVSSFLSV